MVSLRGRRLLIRNSLLPFFLILAVGCGKTTSPSREAVARVNGEVITLGELRDRLEGIPGEEGAVPELVLKEIIKERILLQKAKELGLRPPHSVLDLMAEEIQGKVQQPSAAPLIDLERRLEQIWLMGKVTEWLCPPSAVPEEEVKTYYRTHRQEFRLPPKVIARQIVVTTRGEAQRILKVLKARKATFEEMAKRYSIGPEGERGGLMPPIYKGEEPPGFGVLFTLRRGKVSGVIHSPYGYHIFKVVRREGARVLSYSRVRSIIKKRIQEAEAEDCLQRWLASAMQKGKIEIYKDKLSLLEEEP